MWVAHGAIDDLPDGETPDVARQNSLQQRFGIGTEDFEFPQRREVHDHSPLAARPVFFDGAGIVECGRQPVPPVFGEIAGMF